MDEENEHKMKGKFSGKLISSLIKIGILITIVIVVIISVIALGDIQKNKPKIITVATLEKIVEISDLSTFQAVYNGIAQVMNEKKPEKIDYHVSYEAKVNAGFDFQKLEIDLDDEAKKIVITIPEIKITDVVVDITTLDYMFYNEKANTETISEQAYKVCIADVKSESETTQQIYELARDNAKNVVEALIKPFVTQLDSDYELEIN